MQVFTTPCPYCHHEVDSTIENLDKPVFCPGCKKPFQVEIPTAVVTSIHQVDEKLADTNRTAVEPEELTLVEVHPVVFRARPIAASIVFIAGIAAIGLMIMSLAGVSLAGYSLGETPAIGPASLLTWMCAITVLVIACVIGYWMMRSKFTTLTITDNRTIFQEGVISRQMSEVQHSDVRNLQLVQSFIQRLLNVGGVGISSSGQDELEIVANRLSHPEQIIDCIRKNQT